MEQLLEDIQPPRDKVFDDLAKELREGLVCPVLMGSATRTNGVLRLMKAFRHEVPSTADTAKRLSVKAGNDPVFYVLKTLHTSHGGKMSIARVLNGQVGDGTTFVNSERDAGRVAGVFKLLGQTTEKRGPAQAGETVALGKLEHANTGDTSRGNNRPARRSRRTRRCWRSRSSPRNARTTSSSARLFRNCSKRIPRSASSTMRRRMKW
jgi:elongation factor G